MTGQQRLLIGVIAFAALGDAYLLADAGKWFHAVIFGLGLPAGAVWEWAVQRKRSPEAGLAAERMLVVVLFAQMAITSLIPAAGP